MAVNYPDPVPLPTGGTNLNPNPGAEVNAAGLAPYYEYIRPSDVPIGDPAPPPPAAGTLTVARATNLFHSGTASFVVNKTSAVDRTYDIGVEMSITGLTPRLGCIIDYWIYLPTGSGANAGNGTLGLQPMPSIIDPTLPSPETDADADERGISLTMRADPPTTEGSWLRQQVTFYPTVANLVFRLEISYNDVYVGPQSFYVDDIVVMHDPSLGIETAPEPEPEPEPVPVPPVTNLPPVPFIMCSTDKRSAVTPVVLISGHNLFADARAYWWLEKYRPDSTPRAIPPDTLGTFETEYNSYADITEGFTQVEALTRTDGHGVTENIQYVFPLPITDGEFGIIDIDAPLDTWYQYEATIRTNDPLNPIWKPKTQQCYINSSLFAPTYAGCSAALLSDPLVVSAAQWFGLTSIDPLSWPARRELFEVIAAEYPIAQADIRMMARTTIRGVTLTLPERTKMLEILATGRILRLRIPDPQYPEANWYLSVGNVSENRILTDHRRPERRWELEVAVVQRPVGAINQWKYTRTYKDVLNFEDDGVTPLVKNTTQTYEWVRNNYVDYLALYYGKTYSSQNANLPTNLVYGQSRFPTVLAAQTSINWLPELPVS
jgi:hypothetical protein